MTNEKFITITIAVVSTFWIFRVTSCEMYRYEKQQEQLIKLERGQQ